MKENNFIIGIIGGIIGGFIASIPWILMYVYGNMILSALAIIIAIGVLKGYQIFKGKVDNKLPIIIAVISIICVTVSTLIIIPALFFAQDGMEISIENFKLIYSYTPFVEAITKDYIISLIFTVLGISGVVSNVKKQISMGKTENIKASLKYEVSKEEIEKVREVFIKYEALDKTTALDFKTLSSELNMNELNSILASLVQQRIIGVTKGKYYLKTK